MIMVPPVQTAATADTADVEALGIHTNLHIQNHTADRSGIRQQALLRQKLNSRMSATMSKLQSLKDMAVSPSSTSTPRPSYTVLNLDPEIAVSYESDAHIAKMVTSMAPFASSTKPIILNDDQRRAIEKILDVNIKDGQHLTERMQQMARINLTSTRGSKRFSHEITIPGNVLERLESRRIGSQPLHEFVEETIIRLLKLETRSL